jgi:hypothetical protein
MNDSEVDRLGEATDGHRDYSAAGHANNRLVPGLGIWFVVLARSLAA